MHKDPLSMGRGRHDIDLWVFLRGKTFPRGKSCILVSDVQALDRMRCGQSQSFSASCFPSGQPG